MSKKSAREPDAVAVPRGARLSTRPHPSEAAEPNPTPISYKKWRFSTVFLRFFDPLRISLDASGSGLPLPWRSSWCGRSRRAGRYSQDRGQRHHPSAHVGDHRRSGNLIDCIPDRSDRAPSEVGSSVVAMAGTNKKPLPVLGEAWRYGYQPSEGLIQRT